MTDLQTFRLLLGCSDFLTALLICAYWSEHRKDRTLGVFFFSKCLLALSWTMLFFEHDHMSAFLLLVINLCCYIGIAMEISAFLRLIHRYNRITRWIYIYLIFIGFCGCLFILLFDNHESVRIAFFAFGVGIFAILPAYQMIRKRVYSRLTHLMGYLFFIVVFASGVIMLLSILKYFSILSLSSGLLQFFSFMGIYLVFFLSNTGFIMIKNELTGKELTRQANHDDLTKALNRRAFYEEAALYLRSNARKFSTLSFLIFDIDNFKGVNDQYGHEAGDRVLQDLANRIYLLIKRRMIFGRFGGDEFCLFMPNQDEMDSSQFAEHLRQAVSAARVPLKDNVITYSISIGLLTILVNDQTTVESLYVSCDTALYEAKKNGKNKVCRGQYEAAAAKQDKSL